MKYLVVGNGYLGNQIAKSLGATILNQRITAQRDISGYLWSHQPSCLINCIGKTGTPNVDWCESNKEETFFSNVVVPTYLWNSCKQFGIKMVHIGSGCIYTGDNGGEGYSETDTPNFDGSYYSWTKIVSERFLKDHNVLQLRIRMPLSDEYSPRNLLTKLLGYKKILSVPNSITYVPDMIDVLKKLLDKDATGIYNVVNKGAILHPNILATYFAITGNTDMLYETIGIEELESMIVAKRSNCVLSTKKLEQEGIEIPSAANAVYRCVTEYVKNEKQV